MGQALNYIFFDKDGNYANNGGGFDQVSAAALNSFEQLSLSYTPSMEGYLLIYVANQTNENLNVYFDDMTVAHIEGPIVRTDDYYPFGLTFNSSERSGHTTNNFLYNGKELQTDLDLGWYDYGARMYDAALGRFHIVDPSSETYEAWTPYNYVANNPILLIDPFGTDWFYYRKEGEEEASWNWQDGSKYNHTYTYTEDGEEKTGNITLQGVEAVVVFEGSMSESLGENDNLYGEGANLATATVYGPDGADDIQTYEAYTMTSDPQAYGIVADGIYEANYRNPGKRGALPSNWALHDTGNVPMVVPSFNSDIAFSNPNVSSPNTFGTPIKDGIYIHRSNYSGFAGGNVSTGCLLIAPGRNGDGADWNRFNNQLSGVQNLAVQITRRGFGTYIISDNNGRVLHTSKPQFWGRPQLR